MRNSKKVNVLIHELRKVQADLVPYVMNDDPERYQLSPKEEAEYQDLRATENIRTNALLGQLFDEAYNEYRRVGQL